MREELTGRFGGLTVFLRAPAEGVWEAQGDTKRDDIVVIEVMADQLDGDWWHSYRGSLERAFRQETIVIRAQSVELL